MGGQNSTGVTNGINRKVPKMIASVLLLFRCKKFEENQDLTSDTLIISLIPFYHFSLEADKSGCHQHKNEMTHHV